MTFISRSLFAVAAFVLLGFVPAARADTDYDISYNYNFNVLVGIDTVLAPDGVTVVETLADIVMTSVISPNFADLIATDSDQPAFLQNNAGDFATLTPWENAVTEMCGTLTPALLDQAGTIQTSGVSFAFSSGIWASSTMDADLIGSVPNASVTGDSSSLFYDTPDYLGIVEDPVDDTSVCGTLIPDGDTPAIVSTVHVNTFVENITEQQNSATVPEPASWILMLGVGVILFLAPVFRRAAARR
jgi:hypothetical protein